MVPSEPPDGSNLNRGPGPYFVSAGGAARSLSFDVHVLTHALGEGAEYGVHIRCS